MFKKILIANRGEIALRIIRTCKEMGIKSVAVYSTADAESLHVKFADEAVCIGPSQSIQSYLKPSNIIAAAEITNADAIHPGYGFLSENSKFSKMCSEHDIKFIGASSDMISKMGCIDNIYRDGRGTYHLYSYDAIHVEYTYDMHNVLYGSSFPFTIMVLCEWSSTFCILNVQANVCDVDDDCIIIAQLPQ